MNPWLAGLGAGLQSAGQSAMQILAQEQARKEREDERKRLEQERKNAQLEADRKARLAAEQQLAQFAFQNGLTSFEAAEAPVKQLEQAGSALSSFKGAELPGGFGLMLGGTGDALSEIAKKSRAQLERGRTLTMPMGDGSSRTYFQPYERTKEGMEAAERTRGIKALTDAGYSLEEATAIMNSPDKLQSAVLERIRPKTTPQRVIGPDGTVSFVTPPASMEPGSTYTVPGVKANVSVPGQSPYNWSVQTDDSTGTVVLVDPRSGQTKPVTTPNGDPMRNIPEAVKTRANSLATMRANMERLRELVSQHGVTLMPGEAKAALESARTQAQIAWKEYAKLGALSGPDMGLVIDAIGDPTSPNAVPGGSKAILAKIDEAVRALGNEEQLFTKTFNYQIPTTNVGGAQPLQLTPAEETFARNARGQGVKESDIMAFIRRKRAEGGQ